jgi:hypothetical protein
MRKFSKRTTSYISSSSLSCLWQALFLANPTVLKEQTKTFYQDMGAQASQPESVGSCVDLMLHLSSAVVVTAIATASCGGERI